METGLTGLEACLTHIALHLFKQPQFSEFPFISVAISLKFDLQSVSCYPSLFTPEHEYHIKRMTINEGIQLCKHTT